MLIREELEANEEKFLAPYGVRSRESRGRRYKENEHPFRSLFQRDRDRIIHSTAFRRLEYKTQVFVNHEGDYYRTRLTHTIEVNQIARTIARALGLNEDLTEAIALAHDLGHTPFGHAGEKALSELMRDFGGFEHNQQGLRVVDKLEKKYQEFDGLNLTYEVREGIIKHHTPYDLPEYQEFKPAESPTLECQVVSLADEIAYTSHDLDDGLKAGLIEENDLRQIKIWFSIYEKMSGNISNEEKVYKTIRSLINLLVTDLVKETEKRLKEFRVSSLRQVREMKEFVSLSQKIEKENKELKQFLFEKMYCHYRVIRMAEKARRIIESLFMEYIKEPKQLPSLVQESLKEESVPRIVCDYIAGMTDRFALGEYKKLFDPYTRV
ncbi:MAG: deoxyguanosinetriphosphate triphosphohydrolase [bacterium (Candidatus Ratteibacteria) CG_4_10_14_3_um_filter_41_18]|uniref:Deoxyguanosinetriphosphate triphosphohydrolase-like protein n=4 Tax=Candidatus Ratteibacteria TaxID=2979319 RepID=A0A2M7E6H8_9BACT|nr:MAG: deoxyguanosinetriphosphate triphosphohydrolase [Candidatus Omnitrophica bacterium CG1_02_41_171]PIV63346.1 MAG: deoxyguanosinetriphosphate triphosphohydrolase [bacterium (Candidatus Ratteibacteria) CG01_land_8_20_14_3_00_40_19]PIW33808.1 MAG: deoxyguanosinetriphosphate triphosphohydrolase [bacterium (Candidatus Ratteibacteria) CG15_BIG_FIL_POST_REV_8_21_14_020_41_12]PIW74499.1 MAG: deoxyguanosinetriphosphate triphosphohydrolase [bacterium (Candidatus Ratteibacteria) CG_4_8_14_3_um_filter